MLLVVRPVLCRAGCLAKTRLRQEAEMHGRAFQRPCDGQATEPTTDDDHVRLRHLQAIDLRTSSTVYPTGSDPGATPGVNHPPAGATLSSAGPHVPDSYA